MIVLVDIGNTCYHLYLNKKDGNKVYRFYNKSELVKFFLTFDKHVSYIFYISSVNSIKSEIFIKAIPHTFKVEINLLSNTNFLDKTKKLGYQIDNLDVLGQDLLFDILSLRGPYLIADYGTASKYIYVDKNNKLVGGAIGPGLALINKSLFDNTEKLNNFKIEIPSALFSLKTSESINSMTTYGEAFKLISYYNSLVQLDHNESINLVLTGGDGKIIKEVLTKLRFNDFTLDDELIFKGMSIALELNLF